MVWYGMVWYRYHGLVLGWQEGSSKNFNLLSLLREWTTVLQPNEALESLWEPVSHVLNLDEERVEEKTSTTVLVP